MILKSLTPNLMVEDVDRTVEFYQERLDFALEQTVPESGPFEWASMKSGAVEVMFQARSSLSQDFPELSSMSTGGTLTLYMHMQGLEDLYARLKDRVVILQELQDTFYGMREFSMKDPNGYILVFAEPIER